MSTRKKKRLTRDEKLFLSLYLASLGLAFVIAALISNITGRFNNVVFFVTAISIFAVLATTILVLSLPSIRGKIGERRVNKALKDTSNKNGGNFFKGIIIPSDNGKTAQIDQIYVSRKGVFVIETKNYSGRIYGSDKQKEWTQVLAYGKRKFKMYNPVMQNGSHIHKLKETLKLDFYVENIVVFAQGNIDFIESESVYTISGMKKAIAEAPNKLGDEELLRISTAIKDYSEHPVATQKEHIQQIKQTKSDIDNGVCPRCGGKLVLRTNKKDGSQFYGCSNYPNCRFTKKIN